MKKIIVLVCGALHVCLEKSDKRTVWQAFGDGMLRQDMARQHLLQVQEAVHRSAAEIFYAFHDVSIEQSECADAIIPIPLSPTESLQFKDILPDGNAPPWRNQKQTIGPLYWFTHKRKQSCTV